MLHGGIGASTFSSLSFFLSGVHKGWARTGRALPAEGGGSILPREGGLGQDCRGLACQGGGCILPKGGLWQYRGRQAGRQAVQIQAVQQARATGGGEGGGPRLSRRQVGPGGIPGRR